MTSRSQKWSAIHLTHSDAQKILDNKLPEELRGKMTSLTENALPKLRYRPIFKTYTIHLAKSSYLLYLQIPSSELDTLDEKILPNTLHEISSLITLISVKHHPEMGVIPRAEEDGGDTCLFCCVDDSLSIIPYEFMLQRSATLQVLGDIDAKENALFSFTTITSARDKFSFEKVSVLQYMLGNCLAAYNSLVNPEGRFGFPSGVSGSAPRSETEKDEEKQMEKNWRESFCEMFSSLLAQVESLKVDLPYSFIRARLSLDASQGIFDSVTTPHLVIFPTYEDDTIITVDLTDPDDDPLPLLIGLNPRLDCALWGDRLMEVSLLISKVGTTPGGGLVLDGYRKYLKDHRREDVAEIKYEHPAHEPGAGYATAISQNKDKEEQEEEAAEKEEQKEEEDLLDLSNPSVHLRRMWYDIFFHLFVLADDTRGEDDAELVKDSREWILEWGRRMAIQLKEAGLLDDDDDDDDDDDE